MGLSAELGVEEIEIHSTHRAGSLSMRFSGETVELPYPSGFDGIIERFQAIVRSRLR